jgi:solute carrier family 26 (sodium-independent sulfate anion transporter), member 11
MSTATKVGHGLAKVLGIKLEDPTNTDRVTRGESLFSVSSADTYVETEPTVGDWFKEYTPTLPEVGSYFYNLFPFVHWITRYNLQWLYGDLVAGV